MTSSMTSWVSGFDTLESAEGRFTGMSVLILLYPSPTVADLVDPLNLSMAHHEEVLFHLASWLREPGRF